MRAKAILPADSRCLMTFDTRNAAVAAVYQAAVYLHLSDGRPRLLSASPRQLLVLLTFLLSRTNC